MEHPGALIRRTDGGQRRLGGEAQPLLRLPAQPKSSRRIEGLRASSVVADATAVEKQAAGGTLILPEMRNSESGNLTRRTCAYRALGFDFSAPFSPSSWTPQWQEEPHEPQGSPTWSSTLTPRTRSVAALSHFTGMHAREWPCDGLRWPIAHATLRLFAARKVRILHRRQQPTPSPCARRGARLEEAG